MENGGTSNTTTSSTSISKCVVNFDTLDVKVQQLLKIAKDTRDRAYVPYSKFAVGACLETEDGQLIGGCNVENSSFTVGTCAERCAIFKAISEGSRKFRRIAVVAHQENFFTTPCGACRQMMSEFGDYGVYISKPALERVLVTSVSELLPLGFQINSDYTFN